MAEHESQSWLVHGSRVWLTWSPLLCAVSFCLVPLIACAFWCSETMMWAGWNDCCVTWRRKKKKPEQCSVSVVETLRRNMYALCIRSGCCIQCKLWMSADKVLCQLRELKALYRLTSFVCVVVVTCALKSHYILLRPGMHLGAQVFPKFSELVSLVMKGKSVKYFFNSPDGFSSARCPIYWTLWCYPVLFHPALM